MTTKFATPMPSWGPSLVIPVYLESSTLTPVGEVRITRKRKVMDVEADIKSAAVKQAVGEAVPAADLGVFTAFIMTGEDDVASADASTDDITRVTVKAPIGWCPQCIEKDKRAEQIRSTALLRQTAINIEYELKVIVVGLMSAKDASQFCFTLLEESQIDRFKVMNTPMAIFLGYVQKSGRFDDFKAAYMDAVGEMGGIPLETIDDLRTLRGTLKEMKDGFKDEAHPTQKLNGVEADAAYCVGLRADQFPQLDAHSQGLIDGRIMDLARIRRRKGVNAFLLN